MEMITPFFPNGSFTAFQLSSSQLAEYRFRMVGKPTPTQLFTQFGRQPTFDPVPEEMFARAQSIRDFAAAVGLKRHFREFMSEHIFKHDEEFSHIWRRSIVYSGPPDRAFNALAALVEALLCSLKLLRLHSWPFPEFVPYLNKWLTRTTNTTFPFYFSIMHPMVLGFLATHAAGTSDSWYCYHSHSDRPRGSDRW